MDDITLWKEFRRFRINEHRGPAKGTPPQWGRGYYLVLECLNEGEGKTQREIAEHAEIRAQTLSEALVGMEERGLIERVADPKDRRAVRVYITPKGIRFREEREIAMRRKAEELFRPLSEEEKQTLFDILRKLTTAQREEE
ncbi:MAG: MarR family transcriptional regulator [Clostridia bacterium]|nr:MarR family transcriptional regulator [Clostridia bacterium]